MKLTFRYGTMGSGKTLQMLSIVHEYRKRDHPNFKVKLVAPAKDVRHGKGAVKSRIGIENRADYLIEDGQRIQDVVTFFPGDQGLLLVDEAQFLSAKTIDSLRELADDYTCDVDVICYGLRTNYLGELFEGSKRLFELADKPEHIESLCSFCLGPAVFNMRLPHVEGGEFVLGGEDAYVPACSPCYFEETGNRDA